MRIAIGMKEDGLLKGVWTVKALPEGMSIPINTEDDLNNPQVNIDCW